MMGGPFNFDPASAIVVLDGLIVIALLAIALQNFAIFNRIARIEQQLGYRLQNDVWGDVPKPPAAWREGMGRR